MYNFANTLTRFPLPLLCSFAAYLLTELHDWKMYNFSFKVFIILLCSGLFSLALKVYFEGSPGKESRYYILSLLGGLAIALKLSLTEYTSYNSLFFITFFFLVLFVTPYTKPGLNEPAAWWFNYQLINRLVLATVSVCIISIAILITQYSVTLLFGTDLGPIHNHIFKFTSLVLAPFIVMAGIPLPTITTTSTTYPKSLALILKYCIIPFLFLYSAILYLYALKTLIAWQLPEGKVACLVLLFGMVGIASHIAIGHFGNDNRIFGFFTTHFFKLLVIPGLLLTAAITVRIKEYGITESRYLTILLLLWFVISILYSFFSGRRILHKKILGTLASLLLISTSPIGGAEALSEWSQTKRLKSLLLRHEILKCDKIHLPSKSLTKADATSIYNIVNYLIKSGKTNQLETWFPDATKPIKAKDVMRKMGVQERNDSTGP